MFRRTWRHGTWRRRICVILAVLLALPSRLELGLEELANELVRRRIDNLIAGSMLGDAAVIENDEPLR